MNRFPRILSGVLAIAISPCALAVNQIRDVPGEYPTIQHAVNACVTGDRVRIAAGTYYENVMVVSKGIEFLADGPVTIHPDVDAAIFTVQETWDEELVQFTDITFGTVVPGRFDPHGDFLQDGHAILGDGARIQCTGCIFTSCAAGVGDEQEERTGGAVRANASQVWIDQCTFSNCSATWGGAVAAEGGALTVTQSSFAGCEGELGGGAVLAWLADVQLEQCRFSENLASAGYGGHILQLGGTLDLHRCLLHHGWALDGGAVFAGSFFFSEPEAAFTSCHFADNVAGEGVDVWQQVAGIGPMVGNGTFCGTGGCDGVIWPIWEVPVADSCETCIGEVDNDGDVDMDDLIDLLLHWGQNDPFTDLNWDETTDSDDLTTVLFGFGDCWMLD